MMQRPSFWRAADVPARSRGALRLDGFALRDNLVDDAEGLGLLRRHEMVAVERALDRVVILAGVLHIDLVEPPLQLDDVLRVPLDIGSLALEAARRLMHHDASIGRCEPHTLVAG